VVLSIVAVVVLEGLASVGLLTGDIAAIRRPPVANFRQSAYDSLVGWVSFPNLAIRDDFGPGLALTTNADGLRIHRPVARALAPGERRIMCSGASFTFGSGVADGDTFCARLEQELPGVRTLNVAQLGYGVDQSFLWYRRDGARWPSQVHLFIVNGSDLDRTASKDLTGYAKPVLAVDHDTLVARNVPVPRWTGWSRWDQAKGLVPDLRIAQVVANRVDLSETAQYRRVDAKVWPMMDVLLRDLARLDRERHAAPVLVYLPGEPEFAPGPRDERRRHIARSAAAAGIPVVDLTADLRAVAPDSLDWMYITPNALPVRGSGGHFTPTGHRWVAQRLAEHLRALPSTAAALALPPAAAPAAIASR